MSTASVERELPRVLIVDDRAENRRTIGAVLEPLPCALVTAASGEDALRHLLVDEFAAILLDIQMPGLDGYETAEHIRGRDRTRDVPLMFVSAVERDRDRVLRGYRAGAVDFVSMPCDPDVLRAKVLALLDLRATGRPPAVATLSLPPEPVSARHSRHFVETKLKEWGCDAILETVKLLVSELVTNAVVHAATDVRLIVARRQGHVRVEVSDHDVHPARARHAGELDTTGRGLELVEGLAQAWGSDRHPSGKTVWFEIALADAGEAG